MTIVVAGYNYGENIWRESDGDDAHKAMRQEGLFAVADSIITSHSSKGHSPLLSGFKKIKEVQIKLWQPYFVGGQFRSYNSVYQQTECFVAFAGSTLTAQHVIDLISNHLANLRIDYERATCIDPPKYLVKKNCDSNTLISNGNGSLYDREMFNSETDFRGLLTGAYICDVVEHSINKALSSARKHKLDQAALAEMYTEFILGVTCPASQKDYLVKFKMDKRLNDDSVYEVFARSYRVPEGEVAVIGMSERFEASAQLAAHEAIENGESLKSEMEEFVVNAIKEINDEGSYQIAMPVVIKELVSQRLTKRVRLDETMSRCD